MAKTLYKISRKYEGLIDLCYDETADEETIRCELETLDGSLTDKVSNGIDLIKSLEAEIDGYRCEIELLAQVQQVVLQRLNWLKNCYIENLTRNGVNKVLTPRGAMKITTDDWKELKIDCEDMIPPEYKRKVTRALINKDAIREALERGEKVPGAHLEERGKYLRVSKG